MPRYAALGDAHALRKIQTAAGYGVGTRYPVRFARESEVPSLIGQRRNGKPPAPGQESDDVVAELEVLQWFEAPDDESADLHFRRLRDTGCPAGSRVEPVATDAAKVWRFRGDGKYLTRRIDELAGPHVILKHVQANRYFVDITGLLNQVIGMYRDASRFDGRPRLTPQQRAGAAATLKAADEKLDHLAVTFAAAADAIDEARDAMGIPAARRYDTPELRPDVPRPTAEQVDDLRAALAERDRRITALLADIDGLSLRLAMGATPDPESTDPTTKKRRREGV